MLRLSCFRTETVVLYEVAIDNRVSPRFTR
jgi:hypothetical protein